MSNNSNPNFVQLLIEGNEYIVSHYGVVPPSNFYADQIFENEIQKWHKKRYQEEPILCVSCEGNNTTIKYITQFLNCQIEITESPLLISGFATSGMKIKAIVCPLFSREDGTDYDEIIKLLKKIEKKIYDDIKYATDVENEEIQELCAIEYAKDHC